MKKHDIELTSTLVVEVHVLWQLQAHGSLERLEAALALGRTLHHPGRGAVRLPLGLRGAQCRQSRVPALEGGRVGAAAGGVAIAGPFGVQGGQVHAGHGVGVGAHGPDLQVGGRGRRNMEG